MCFKPLAICSIFSAFEAKASSLAEFFISDAVAVIVSEETGKISIAMNGTLTRNIAGETLQKALLKMLASEKSQKADKKKSVWRFGKK